MVGLGRLVRLALRDRRVCLARLVRLGRRGRQERRVSRASREILAPLERLVLQAMWVLREQRLRLLDPLDLQDRRAILGLPAPRVQRDQLDSRIVTRRLARLA